MSKPKRMPIGTSENLLKGGITLSIRSHSSGIKGVMMQRRSGDGIALLGIVGSGAAEGADVFTFLAGDLGAARDAIPGVTVTFAGLADSRTGWFLSE